jgi:hypothetical protein
MSRYRRGFGHRLRWPRGTGARLSPVLETFFLVLLGLTFGFIAWFSVYAVYKLYQGQR